MGMTAAEDHGWPYRCRGPRTHYWASEPDKEGWLLENVGPRGVMWTRSLDNQYLFRKEEHFMLFRLVWGDERGR